MNEHLRPDTPCVLPASGKNYRRRNTRDLLGLVPRGMEVDHVCQNPACANPFHLQIVTSGENKRLVYDRQQTCRNGHLLAGEEDLYHQPTGTRPQGRRRCKQCQAEANKRHWAKVKDDPAVIAANRARAAAYHAAKREADHVR